MKKALAIFTFVLIWSLLGFSTQTLLAEPIKAHPTEMVPVLLFLGCMYGIICEAISLRMLKNKES